MAAYRTTPELVAKQIKEFYLWYPHGNELSEVRLLPLDSIHSNLRDYHQSMVDDYAASIASGEAMPPIVVRRYPREDHYSIRDGTHRYLASLANGLTHIPVLIEKNSNRQKRSRLN